MDNTYLMTPAPTWAIVDNTSALVHWVVIEYLAIDMATGDNYP